MSGRGAIAGGVVIGALLVYVFLGVDLTGLGSFGMAGSPPSTASQMAWLAFIATAIAVAGIIAFARDEIGVLRSAAASLAGHAVGVVAAFAAGWILASILDSIVVPATLVGVVGISVAALLAGGRLTRRLGLVAVGIIGASLIAPLGGSSISLLALPLLYVVSWATLTAAAAEA